jgi:hypothetical protein
MRRLEKALCRKALFAAVLLTLYAVVVFTASPSWVAWEGTLVVGSLSLPLPPAARLPLAAGQHTDPMISLLGFLSVAALLALTVRLRKESGWLSRLRAWWKGQEG